jgi:hypothetical protein
MLSTIVAALLASSAVGFVGDRLTLAWSFSPLLDNVAGYAVVSGPETCSTWTQATDVGNVTRYSFPAGAFDPSRPTCFAVQAYGEAVKQSEGASLEDVGSLWFRTPAAAGTYPVTLEAENQYGCTATLATGANGKPMTITVK